MASDQAGTEAGGGPNRSGAEVAVLSQNFSPTFPLWILGVDLGHLDVTVMAEWRNGKCVSWKVIEKPL